MKSIHDHQVLHNSHPTTAVVGQNHSHLPCYDLASDQTQQQQQQQLPNHPTNQQPNHHQQQQQQQQQLPRTHHGYVNAPTLSSTSIDHTHKNYYQNDQQQPQQQHLHLSALPGYNPHLVHRNLHQHTHHHPNLSPVQHGSNAHPAHQQHHGQHAYRRSLSGSETDISTSTENLTHEEQYVLRNSTRQEPQGEETLDLEDSGGGGCVIAGGSAGGGGGGGGGLPSVFARGGSWISATTGLGSSYASMDQSSCKTLIIHNMDHDDDFRDDDDEDDGGGSCADEAEEEDDEDFNGGDSAVSGSATSCSGAVDASATRDGRRTPSSVGRHYRYRSRSNRSGDVSARSSAERRCGSNSGNNNTPPHYCQQQQQQQQHYYQQQQHQMMSGGVSGQYAGAPTSQQQPPRYAAAPSLLHQEVTDIPHHYLDQSEVLKHLLVKEMQACAADAMMMPYATAGHHVPPYVAQAFFGTDFDLSQLPPPPEYPGVGAAGLGGGGVGGKSGSMMNQGVISSLAVASPSSETTDGSTTATSPSDSSPGFQQFVGCSRMASTPVSAASLLSRSQPDLSRLGGWSDDHGGRRGGGGHFSPRPRTKGKASADVSPSLLHQRAHSVKYGGGSVDAGLGGGSVDAGFDKINRALLLENRQLKSELDIFTTKVSRLQKFEVDIQKVHQAYEELVKSSQKRESLNVAVRGKLELEVRRLHDVSKDLKDRLDSSNGNQQRRFGLDDNSDAGKQELQCRDQFIAQLIQQNKELTVAKERHEIELAAQRVTLQEQRTHIDILDSALTNAQANVVKLEDECRKKAAYVERVAQLQRALTALQVASERREQMERKLRNQLERDLNELRQRHLVAQQAARNCAGGSGGSGGRPPSGATSGGELVVAGGGSTGELRSGVVCGGSGSGGGSSMTGSKGDVAESAERAVDDLKSAVRAKEERIMALETDISKWEQRYLEENAMRQMAIDAASMPKDAKIAALERTSQESEKLIAEARTDRLRQMDELHLSHRRCADLEGRAHDLESRLAERDAMLKVLHKHQLDRDAAFRSAVLRSPRHTPHASFHHTACSSAASSSAVASAKLGGSGTIFSLHAGGATIGSQEEIVGVGGVDVSAVAGAIPGDAAVSAEEAAAVAAATHDSLDEQLKKLDSQLLSKDSIINALRSEKEKYPSHYWMV